MGTHAGLAALVVVDTLGLVRGRMKPRRTDTVEATVDVSAGSAAADVSSAALVGVLTRAVGPLLVARAALAAVALRGVHAPPVGTQVAPQQALVDLLPRHVGRRNVAQHLAVPGRPRRARLAVAAAVTPARLCPAHAHGVAAAAVQPGQREAEFVGALAEPVDSGETVSLAAVQAGSPILSRDEARVADAVEAGVGVDTAAVVAGVAARLALVLIDTLLVVIESTSLRTFTAEGSDSVETIAPITQSYDK